MTPEELENYSLRTKCVALSTLLDFMTEVTRKKLGVLPPAERAASLEAFEKKFAQARAEYSGITFDDRHPAEGDMLAGIFQEHFDAVSGEVLSKLRRELTAEDWQKIKAAENQSR